MPKDGAFLPSVQADHRLRVDVNSNNCRITEHIGHGQGDIS